MEDFALHPWMLQTDWRGDGRKLLIADFSNWPENAPLDPLPPIPVIATGPQTHPQAPRADILAEDSIPLAPLISRIHHTPRTCAVLVQLLRAIENLPPARALPLESFAFAMLQGGEEHQAWLAAHPPESPTPPGTLHISREGSTLTLLIDRPASRNAIDRAMRDALFEAFSLAAIDPSIQRVKLRGRGKCFSTGADLAEFGTMRDPVQAHAIRSLTLPALKMAERAEIYDVHVQGGCVGSGLELAAYAGRLTAAPDAWFHLPETGMGILPGAGGCVSIPRRIGRQRAAALMISGKRITARLALEWGLIDAIMDEPPLDDGGPHNTGS